MTFLRLRRARAALFGLLMCFIALTSARGQEPISPVAADASKAARPPLSETIKEKNVESFDFVLTTIRDKHFDPMLNGVDWEAVRVELRPKIEKAESMAEARKILGEMIGRLGQSHFGILPQSVYAAIEESEDEELVGGDGVSGIEPRVVEGKALVVAVEAGSAAEEAGVKTGWIISKIEGKDVAPSLEKLTESYKDSTLLDLRLASLLAARLSGPIGHTRKVVFLDAEDQPREVEITLEKMSGSPTKFGNLPTFYINYTGKQVDGDLGYIAFNAFFDPARIMPLVEATVRENMKAPGMILDLRGNPGGIGAMSMGIAGWFVPEGGRKLGTMLTRGNKLMFMVNRRPETYKGPLAILVDGCSASTSEILVQGLKDLGRARVFGTRTAGAALPSVIVRLPNGDGFQYAFANYISEGGQALEGKGVIPDEMVVPDRKLLLEGHDPSLDAAVRWIRSQQAAERLD
jgi:carboxyl-terminal processing protease